MDYHINEDHKMLDVYIHEYLVKKKYINSAKIFEREAQISTKDPASDTPGGFLYEWWSIFSATYFARYYHQGSKTEQVNQPRLQQQTSQQQWLEQQRDNIQLQSNTASNCNTAKQNLAVTNASARKKIPHQKSKEKVNRHSDATHTTLSRSIASEGQLLGQLPYDASLSNLDSYQAASNFPLEGLPLSATRNQILRGRKRDSPTSVGSENAVGMQKSTSMLPISEVWPHGDISSNTQVLCGGRFWSQTFGADQLADSDNSGSLVHNVESFLSSSNLESRNAVAAGLETGQDITFSEVGIIHANVVNHCDLSYDGKLIATGGNDEKIMLWSVDTREQKCLMKEHSAAITDFRFCPMLPRLGTSSLDKTVKIWNINNSRSTLRFSLGHSASVLSLDFHPKNENLICACNEATEIRYWNINSPVCTGVSKANATQVRFQCIHGMYLAAAVRSGVSIIDVETAQNYGSLLQGHETNVNSVCWNSSGEYLASLSEDLIRVWKIGSGQMQQCVHELSISAKKFKCCLFHPSCPLSLIIGFNQSMDIWNVAENKMTTVLEQPINALAVSQYSGLIASASDDNLIKLWK